jgi:leucyl-tRNA synthetase
VAAGISEQEAKAVAMESESIEKFISNKQVRKIIYVPGKLVNIVI